MEEQAVYFYEEDDMYPSSMRVKDEPSPQSIVEPNEPLEFRQCPVCNKTLIAWPLRYFDSYCTECKMQWERVLEMHDNLWHKDELI